jgi:hypothetical protein
MSENIDRTRRGLERFAAGEPDWDLYADDFQLVNLHDAPWQPSPGPKGLQEWLDFTDEVADEWGMEFDGFEELDRSRVLANARLWAKFRAGIREEMQLVAITTFRDDGKMIRGETYYTRDEALEAAGVPDPKAP